jgi:succinyl-CoA---D-citramalate CoA-transferase
VTEPSSRGPLARVRIVEAGSLIAGPFCGRLLADFGAEVIKVEPPGKGDPMRQWGGTYKGVGLWWPNIARNKKSVTLDLRVPEGQELFRRLTARADAVIENFRPGTMERWDLGYEHLRAVNPALVMTRVTGFGQTGPYRDRAGFGSIGESMGGLRYVTGFPDRPPLRVGITIGDSLAATFGALGTMIALYHRDTRGGTGQFVDVAIYEAVWAMMESAVAEYDKLGWVRSRTGGRLPGIAPSNTYPTGDGGFVVIGANADNVFRRFVAVLDHPEWADDPRFNTHTARGTHEELLDDLIAQWTATLPTDEILRRLEEAGVPSGRIYSVADIVSDPHYHAREMLLSVFDPQLDEDVRMQGVIPKLSDTPGEVHHPGPSLGEHNDEVYGKLLELSEEQLADLKSRGIV